MNKLGSLLIFVLILFTNNLYAQSQLKISASDGALDDNFGWSASISGDYAVIGSRFDDDNGEGSGSAYVFKRDSTTWTQQAKLVPADGAAGDEFGISVSISGDYIVVGAFADADNGTDAGSAYIFKRDSTSWTQQAKLLSSDGALSDFFGNTVSISGDYAVIGALLDDDNGNRSGSAYVFKRDSTTWTQQDKLLASDGVAEDNFGSSVSISGDYIVVSSRLDDDNGTNAGSAYVFKRDTTSWSQQAKLLASDGAAGDEFGISVSISGDYAIVGAYFDDDKGTNTGSAYVFKRNNTSWTQQSKLLPSEADSLDFIGSSVSISGDNVILSARFDDERGIDAGSAYVFRRDSTTWTQEAKLLASDGALDDNFGWSASISGDFAVIGAIGEDDNGSNSGSAYIYSGVSTVFDTTITLMIEKTWADPGDTVEVIISISNDDSVDISALEIDVHFDNIILAFDTTNRDTSSIIGTGWLFEDNLKTDTVSVAAASDSAFNISGNLYTMTFIVSDTAKDNDESILSFGDVTLNAGSPAVDSLMNGFIQVVVAGGDVDSNLTVQAFDASQILTFVSDTLNLSLWKQLEADVSDNDVISSFDASLILQFVVGSINEFPSQADTATAAPAFGSLALVERVGAVGEEVVIPINGVNLSSLFSGSFNLLHDSEILRFKEVRTTTATDGFLTASKSNNGEITLYMAGAHSVEGDRTLLEVVYIRLNNASTDVILRSATLNDNLIWTDGYTATVEFAVSVQDEQLIPGEFELSQNYPNPFNPMTTINYALPKESHVRLIVYNLLGEEVARLVNEQQTAGYKQISWDASTAASGIYFYRLQAGEFVLTRKMVLLK